MVKMEFFYGASYGISVQHLLRRTLLRSVMLCGIWSSISEGREFIERPARYKCPYEKYAVEFMD
jgi:hypothetical protein